jgi:hypothetical protein
MNYLRDKDKLNQAFELGICIYCRCSWPNVKYFLNEFDDVYPICALCVNSADAYQQLTRDEAIVYMVHDL